MAAYHVVWECVVEQWLGVRRTHDDLTRSDKIETCRSVLKCFKAF